MEGTKLPLDSFALVGKSSSGDFTTAYASKTTITLGAGPAYHATIILDDIEIIRQISADGNVIATYARDAKIMNVTTGVLTIPGADFKATDTFIIYTNVGRTTGSNGIPSSSVYDYAKFTVATGISNYDVATQQADLFDDVVIAGKMVVITDQTITVKLNSTGNKAIEITSSESPRIVDSVAITNAFITNASGSTANIKISLFN